MKYTLALGAILFLALSARADLARGQVVYASPSAIVIVNQSGDVLLAYPLSPRVSAGLLDKFPTGMSTRISAVKVGDTVNLYHSLVNGVDTCQGIWREN